MTKSARFFSPLLSKRPFFRPLRAASAPGESRTGAIDRDRYSGNLEGWKEAGRGRGETVGRHCRAYSIFSPVRWRATLFLPREEHRHGSPRRMGGRSTGPRLITGTGSNESGLLARGR